MILKESDLHTKRTGHTEFVDKTSEAAKPISLEVPKAASEVGEAGASSSQSEGTFLVYCFRLCIEFSSYSGVFASCFAVLLIFQVLYLS